MVQDVLTDDFLCTVKEKGKELCARIEALGKQCLGKTRGMGLMIGIEVKGEEKPVDLAKKLLPEGLLVLTAGDGLRLLPPLVITDAEIAEGVGVLDRVLV